MNLRVYQILGLYRFGSVVHMNLRICYEVIYQIAFLHLYSGRLRKKLYQISV